MNNERPPRVLFVSYGGGHIGMVLPVIAELEKQHPGIDCRLLALTTGHLKAAAVRPTLGYRDFWHLVDAPLARAWGERLSEGNTSPDVPAEETQAYLGINYLALIEQMGEEGAAAYFKSHGRRGFQPLPFMRKVLADVQPDLVVATNSPRSEQAALEAAHERGLPCLAMVDLFGLDSDPFVSRPIKPSVTCVLSEPVRERLMARGFAPDTVKVTGNPAFDGLFAAGPRHEALQYLKLHGWSGLRHILFAGHSEPYPHPATHVPEGRFLPLQITDCLSTYVASRMDTCLTIRYHPSDWHTYPSPALHDRIRLSIPRTEPLHPIILSATAVVVQTSTVGLEASVSGVPVISVENSPAAHIWFSLATLGVSTPCPSPQDLADCLDALFDNRTMNRESLYQSDGHAARRVASLALACLSHS